MHSKVLLWFPGMPDVYWGGLFASKKAALFLGCFSQATTWVLTCKKNKKKILILLKVGVINRITNNKLPD